jgi:anti-sigma factor (TIGR02949 family)
MSCSEISGRLGMFLDGELSAEDAKTIEAHLAGCLNCRAELEALQRVVTPLKAGADVKAPPELWDAIEARLDRDTSGSIPPASGGAQRLPVKPADAAMSAKAMSSRRWWRPLLVAAALLLPVGLVAVFLQLSSPKPAYAREALIDFRPLLANIATDYNGAMAAFLECNHAKRIDLSEAARFVEPRVHPNGPLPYGLTPGEMYSLALGKKHGLLFQFSGPEGKLVISQCPVGVTKVHGDHHCLPCTIGSRPGAEAVHVGPWRLVHLPSDKGCICMLSTFNEQLVKILKALQIEF